MRAPDVTPAPSSMTGWTAIDLLTEARCLELSTAALFPSRLVEDWPQIRELLIESAQAIGIAPITGPTPVLSAPIVRLLCLILAAHGTSYSYDKGCRCEPCRQAKREVYLRHKAAKSAGGGKTPARGKKARKVTKARKPRQISHQTTSASGPVALLKELAEQVQSAAVVLADAQAALLAHVDLHCRLLLEHVEVNR